MQLRRALILFLAVFISRGMVVWFANVGHTENVVNAELGQVAANIAAGRGFSSPLENGSTPTAWFGPVVPYAWAAIFMICGIGTPCATLALHIIQLVLGGLCGLAYWQIAKRVWSAGGGRGDWIPLAIAFVAALWPVGIPRYTLLWYFVWEDLLIALLVLASLVWWRDPTWKHSLLLGVVGGLGGLVNIVPLVFLAGVVGVNVISALLAKSAFGEGLLQKISGHGGAVPFRVNLQGEPRTANGSEIWRCAAVMLLALAVMTPWVVRNRLVLGAWIPGRSVTGIVLLQGNNPRGDIVQSVHTRHPAMDPEERRKFDQWGEIVYNRMASAEAVEYMATHKWLTVKRCLQRLYVFWFTDLFDAWPWQPGPPWWETGGLRAAWRVSQGGLNLIALLLLLWSFFRPKLPGFPVFLSLFLLVPLPYYLSISGWGYGHIIRPYVLLYGLLALAVWWQSRTRASGFGRGICD